LSARLRAAAAGILGAGLRAADPRRAVRKSLRAGPGGLLVSGERVQVKGRVILLAVGKAAVPMAEEAAGVLKHDGYRLIVQREGKRVRLFTRNGYDWSDRYPLIVEAALRNRNPPCLKSSCSATRWHSCGVCGLLYVWCMVSKRLSQ
jgi:hypothetical protein